jgi:acyl-CoA dehydrogenase
VIRHYKNDSPFGVGRQLRDALSARLMVANERIHTIDAGLLTIAKEV